MSTDRKHVFAFCETRMIEKNTFVQLLSTVISLSFLTTVDALLLVHLFIPTLILLTGSSYLTLAIISKHRRSKTSKRRTLPARKLHAPQPYNRTTQLQ